MNGCRGWNRKAIVTSVCCDELDDAISRREAVGHLTLILEAIVENYGEYRDYNSTTTQSDRGEMLYMLLDFLRLRTQYDRVCWHLKPVISAPRFSLVVSSQKRHGSGGGR